MEKQIDGIPVYKQPPHLKCYTYVAYSHGKLFVRGIDDNNRRVMFYSDYQPTVWVPLEFNYTDYKQDIVDVQFNKWKTLIDEKPLVGLTFKSIYACNQFIRQNTNVSRNQFGSIVRETKIHTSPSNHIVSQYIAENFPGELHLNAEQLRILSYDIETEVGHRIVSDDTIVKIRNQNTSAVKQVTIGDFEDLYNDGNWLIWNDNISNWVKYDDHPFHFVGNFPDPLKADERIILITVKDINNNRIDTWGLNEFNNKRDDVVYHQCKDETQLLNEFVDFIVADYPDAITGWNCLNKNSTVWMENCIERLDNIRVNDKLVDSDVVRISDVSMKDEYIVENVIHNKISCSKDHVFPCFVVDKMKYTNFNQRYINPIDLSIENMILNRNHNREVFMLVPKHENTNTDLTYRDVLIEFVDYFLQRGSCIGLLGETFDAKEELIDYVLTNNGVYYVMSKHSKTLIKLDENLSLDFCHLLGLIYTDGSYDKKHASYAYYGSELSMIQRVDNIIYPLTNPARSVPNKLHKPIKGNYSTKFSYNNLFGMLHRMIFDENDKKRLNIKILSRLSSSQFHSFLSGLIDGDGWVSRSPNYDRDGHINSYTTSIGWCNYNDDIATLHELLLWNGYLSSKTSDDNHLLIRSIHNCELKNRLMLWVNYKDQTLKQSRHVAFNNDKSRAFETNVKTTTIDGKTYYVVRIDNIEKTGKQVEMIDIETTSHYFYTQGVKTHNCSVFDNTYVATRIKLILGEEKMKLLSPIREINFKQVEHNEFGKSIVETSWLGISDLDYLRLYKKYTYGNRESYKLDAIAESEIKVKKVPNPIDGSFKEFYSGKFDVRTKPSQDDNEIKKLGWIRTQLRRQFIQDETVINKFKAVDEKVVQMCKQLFIEYNIRDVELVDKIDKKQKFITLAMTIAYLAHCNYEDVFSPVKTWDYTIYNTLLVDNVVIPIKKGGEKSEKFPGAYVKEPLKGKHEFCESSK